MNEHKEQCNQIKTHTEQEINEQVRIKMDKKKQKYRTQIEALE